MKCRYPECYKEAKTHWALVPVCHDHRKAIAEETDIYYNKRTLGMSYDERYYFLAIRKYIPWRNKEYEGYV